MRVHMTATELARDVHAVLEKVLQGVEVVTEQIVAQIGSEQAANGINLPLADVIIGACALELG